MMLANARLYVDEINKKMMNTWYDSKYQYYYGSDTRGEYSPNKESYYLRDFVSLNSKGEVIGLIGYWIDPTLRLANSFGAINFTGEKAVFGKDLFQVIDDIFMKFGMNTFEFTVTCGNPIEKSYDRIIKKIGGRILCVRNKRLTDLAGNLCNDKVYEVTREEYLTARKHDFNN